MPEIPTLAKRRLAALAALAAVAAVLAGCGGPATSDLAVPHSAALAGVKPQSVAELARLDEDEIDIARAAILIARSEYPDLDVERYEREIDSLTSELRRALSGRALTGRTLARALARVVYSKVKARPTPINEITDVTISDVLERKTGTCLSLTTLTLAVAGRLNLPVKAVLIPRHVFARYSSGARHVNIETTRGGIGLPDAFYIKWKGVTPGEIRRGVYMRELTKKEFIAQILVGQGTATSRKNPARAGELFELALKFHPSSPVVLYNLGVLAGRSGDLKAAEEFYNAAIIVNPDSAECYVNRGAVRARLGRPREGVADCTRALALRPGLAEARINRAGAWGMLGDLRRAEADYRGALKIDPAAGVAHLMLARLMAGDGRARDGAAHLRKAIAAGAITEKKALKAPELKPLLRQR